ncbi:AraC family transcriptional regulator ligand-binding domain-containing protein [Vibrio sp. IB15]|uniref:AraC family transcriptional regulator n=1 Tax=Vibrio sp. IB15 TaxID=2779368 RepID=UPI0018E86E44|nr:AraC family transcriptional regulator [Vibrio sp. IB15]MBJ2149149.1 AraC family transcriptional regulator ligand-binding domain-containing protein [Vibrio sp. IB15]
MADNTIEKSVSFASVIDLVNAYSLLPPALRKQVEASNHLDGIILEAIKNSANLSLSDRLPESQMVALWSLLEQHHPSPEIGLIIGRTISHESKGVLASWVSQCATLKDAFNTFQSNIFLMNSSECWQVDDDGQQCRLTLSIESRHDYPRAAIERSMSAVVMWARMLSAHPFPLTKAKFGYLAPLHVDKYQPVFGETIEFNSAYHQLIFESKWLNLPIATSSEYLKTMMAKTAQSHLETLTQTQPLQQQVRTIVVNGLENGELLSIDKVAQQLHFSRQTLYRKLEREHTSFQSILDDTRKQLAVRWLTQTPPPSITELSYRLGFKDTSSFYKAFKRWHQVSPKAYLSR